MVESSARGVQKPMYFEVHPSVLFKLGEDLIRDEGQALAELIKNSYDADARTVRVDVDTEGWYDRNGEVVIDPDDFSDLLRGRVTVQDDGTGMTREVIHDGWLTISSSPKIAMKRSGVTTRRKRTPLGDKGLGRLGVQRLGQIVILETIPEVPEKDTEPEGDAQGDRELRVVIDWSRFDSAKSLSAVPLEVNERSMALTKSGSTIAIVGLRNASFWSGDISNLQRELATIVSPFDSAKGVAVFLTVNGRVVDLRRQARALLDAAPINVEFEYVDGLIHIRTKTRASVLSGRDAEGRYLYRQEILPDNGSLFTEWLLSNRSIGAKRLAIEAGDDQFFLKSSRTFSLEDVRPTRVEIADPGPFAGEISSLSFEDVDATASESILNSISDLRAFTRAMAGIRVYRDGFGIRLDQDWLGLAKQQTSASSYYGLRPANTVGFVNLSAKDNGALEETSSRENFSDTPAWRGFRALMEKVVDEIRDVQRVIRRGWIDFGAQFDLSDEVRQLETPAEIVHHIQNELADSSSPGRLEARARALTKSLGETRDSVRFAQQAAEASVWSDDKLSASLEVASTRIDEYAAGLDELLADIAQTKRDQDKLRNSVRQLANKIEAAESQLASAWESVALGLSAESLSHEVSNLSDRLRGRSSQILKYMRSLDPVDRRTTAYAEEVRASASELARQASRLDPMLRYRRERREAKSASLFVEEALSYHVARWATESIGANVLIEADFQLGFNVGKFSQVIDNLTLNSEFWLRRSLQLGKIQNGIITFTVKNPLLLVRDNGPGISPELAEAVFEPFVTSKPSGEGRGLGLFIVRQILDSERASIHLSEHVNDDGNFDTFVIDFSGSERG